jgi:4-hydroxybenzoate polyprenyltransferase
MSLLGKLASILRLHIIGVAVSAALVFSALLTGHIQWEIAAVGAVDWMLINLLNKLTDLAEDQVNQIHGTDFVADHKTGLTIVWLVVFTMSFVWTTLRFPELSWLRAIVQLIGLGYSISLVPTWRGFRRFKDLYFFKNFMSAVLFVFTVFIYPIAAADWTITHAAGWTAAILLMAFFVPFELTYEIIYDIRDEEGDRAAGVPTYPVAHGSTRARQIIDGLLILSALIMMLGFFTGVIGLRESLMLVALPIQFFFYRPRYASGMTSKDCIWLTHLGSALLLFYLVGTTLWDTADLPANIYLL